MRWNKDFAEMVVRAEELPYEVYVDTNRLRTKCDRAIDKTAMVKDAKGTRPIVHAKIFKFVSEYLAHKQANGTFIEKQVYAGMDALQLISRLLTKRPLTFTEDSDFYLLRDGKTEGNGNPNPEDGPDAETDGPRFEDIGTKFQKPPLTMDELQSYEEMELSALIGMSTPTHYINSGGRGNQGKKVSDRASFQRRGINVGLVGARFEREGLMEWKHMMVTATQNVVENGYGEEGSKTHPMLARWAQLYGISHFPTWQELNAGLSGDRFIAVSGGEYLDTEVYRARCEITAETFWIEADERAAAEEKSVFCHLVGFGLGVWQVSAGQKRIQIQAYAAVVSRLSLPNIGEVYFSWFGSAGSSLSQRVSSMTRMAEGSSSSFRTEPFSQA